MKPTLLVLAAGMGSRFGGLKQLEPMGPNGETILDYSVYDAHRAGFGKVVFVVRRAFEAAFRERIIPRYKGKIETALAFQELDCLPAGFTPPQGREKPWGTAHAVWCAREQVRENFAVINADDFYGFSAYEQLASFLASPQECAQGCAPFVMVAFELSHTLSENGHVSRGVCTVNAEGYLESIEECTHLKPDGHGAARLWTADGADTGRVFAADTPVSMNCWGFTPALFPILERRLTAFLKARVNEPKAESYLPVMAGEAAQDGEATIRVLRSRGDWLGVTYKEDLPRVRAAIAARVSRGEYPAVLF